MNTKNLDPRTEEGYRNAVELLAETRQTLNSDFAQKLTSMLGVNTNSILDAMYTRVNEIHNEAVEKEKDKVPAEDKVPTEGYGYETEGYAKATEEVTQSSKDKCSCDKCRCAADTAERAIDDFVDEYIYDVLIEEYKSVTGTRPTRETVRDARKVLTVYTKWLFDNYLDL